MLKELSEGDRKVVMVMSVPMLLFAIFVMVTRQVGKGPMPIEGPLAVLLGAIFAVFSVATFLYAWKGK